MNWDSIWGWNRGFEVSWTKYLGVPQNDMVSLSEITFPFTRPKSISFIYPSELINIFSGFKSLNNCFCHFEIPTRILHGRNWFSFPRNEKFGAVLWVGWRVGQVGNTGAYQVEIDEAIHEQ